MTVDALLAILLNVAIPSALALAGGILAANALSEEKGVQRAWWSALFIGLALMAIVLAFIQQVRFTTQQQKSDYISQQRDSELKGENKYTQGQLDTLTKVLTSMNSSLTGDSGYKTMVSALLSAARSNSTSRPIGVEPPAIQRMSNDQLRSKVIEFANALRKESSDYVARDSTLPLAFQDPKAWAALSPDQREKVNRDNTNRMIADSNAFSSDLEQKYLGDATEYRDELLRRLGPQSPAKSDLTFWLDGNGGSAIMGLWTARGTADYLERLARQLPPK